MDQVLPLVIAFVAGGGVGILIGWLLARPTRPPKLTRIHFSNADDDKPATKVRVYYTTTTIPANPSNEQQWIDGRYSYVDFQVPIPAGTPDSYVDVDLTGVRMTAVCCEVDNKTKFLTLYLPDPEVSGNLTTPNPGAVGDVHTFTRVLADRTTRQLDYWVGRGTGDATDTWELKSDLR